MTVGSEENGTPQKHTSMELVFESASQICRWLTVVKFLFR